jgi:hypothetical protein
MAAPFQSDELREAIEELKREFLDGIPTPPRPMAQVWEGVSEARIV